MLKLGMLALLCHNKLQMQSVNGGVNKMVFGYTLFRLEMKQLGLHRFPRSSLLFGSEAN